MSRAATAQLCLAALAGALAFAACAPATAHGAPARRVCAPPSAPGTAACDAWVQPAARAARASGGPLPGALSPADFHAAYGLATTGARAQTIAVVNPYGDPTIENDLATFSTQFGLPQCPSSNGCLSTVDQDGHAGPLPGPNGDWPAEAALAVETAHGICQSCRILLVEASSPLDADLATAVDTAARLGAGEIAIASVSAETFAKPQYASHYDHPGVVIAAAAGDSGYGGDSPGFPASLPGVVAVGGTHLDLTADGRYAGETAWTSTGSGCSSAFSAPAWQAAESPAAGCGGRRALNDVAADADPATGAAVYTSTPVPSQGGATGWFQIGGTSLAAPLIAGVFALAGGTPTGISPAATLYARRGSLHDVTGGSNGACGGKPACQAGPGYDGPTGLGTPNGLAAFGASGGGGSVGGSGGGSSPSGGLDPGHPNVGLASRRIRTRTISPVRFTLLNRNAFSVLGSASPRSASRLRYPGARSRARLVTFGARSFRIGARGRVTLTFRLSRARRALLARLRRITLVVTLSLRDGNGRRATVSQRLVLQYVPRR